MIALPRLCRASGVLSIAVLAVALLCGWGTSARAQDFGWFGGLLGGGTPQRSPGGPSFPGYDSGGYDTDSRGRNKDRRRKAQRHKKPASDQAEAPASKPPAKSATVFVGVFGDSLGVFLANGLDDALADRTDVGILHKARGSTGLVTQSFYDWPKAIDELAAKQGKGGKDKTAEKDQAEKKADGGQSEKGQADKKDGKAKPGADSKPVEPEKIDVAVMMIGSNDRQPITEGGKTYARGSDEWTAIYRKRVTAIAEAFQKHKIPLVWVGIPITKEEGFADDMAALNEIYRDVAAKTGATYVDTWEAFSDDNGKFAASGPDINGQTTRLRSSDGIHFTPAGARKLAHFVETPVRRDLDGKAPLPQLPTAEAPAEGKDAKKADKAKDGKSTRPAVAVVKPEAGPIKNLGEAPSAKDGLLAQAPRQKEEAESPGGADATPATRADNFRWSGGGLPQP